MKYKKLYFFLIFFLFLSSGYVYLYLKKNKFTLNKILILDENDQEVINENSESLINSNSMDNVKYSSKDLNGNEYSIYANKGEIELSNRNIIFLTKVKALIKLKNANTVEINSDFGKYNAINFDTIFSKNVIVTYLNNKITSDYLDFSIERNSMMLSRNVVFNHLNNTLKSDVVEMDLKTKDIKIFMYKNDEKVNINNQKLNGNN